MKKIQKCMELLEFIPDPNSLDILRVVEKVGCSEITGWRALKRLRDNVEKVKEEVRVLTELTKESLYLQWFMRTCMVLKVEMKALWKKRLIQISNKLEELRVEFRLDEKGVSIAED